MSNTYMQISAGQGPEECQRVVFLVLEKLKKELNTNAIQYAIYTQELGDVKQSYKSIVLLLKGSIALIQAQWEGTILWVAQSPYRRQHKRKNWFVQVAFFEKPPLNTFHEKDVVFETCRSSGPGGQHVNKVETAVRATHKPTGIQVKRMEGRSQLENKAKCLNKLRAHFKQSELLTITNLQAHQREKHYELERGNPIQKFSESLI